MLMQQFGGNVSANGEKLPGQHSGGVVFSGGGSREKTQKRVVARMGKSGPQEVGKI